MRKQIWSTILSLSFVFLSSHALNAHNTSQNIDQGFSPRIPIDNEYHFSIQDEDEFPWRGKGTKVLMLDSGINSTHPSFNDSRVIPFPIEKTASAIPFQIGMSPSMIAKDEKRVMYNDDDAGHGTAVASSILEMAPQTTLYSIRVFEQNNEPTDLIVRGLNKAAEWQDLDVVNFSGSFLQKQPFEFIHEYFESLRKTGTLLVVAAGNQGKEGLGSLYYPASDKSVLTVGSSSGDFQSVSPFSGRDEVFGMKPDVIAPGEQIEVAQGDGYAMLDGTSLSAPQVTGVAALIKQKFPSWTPDQVKNAISITATPIPTYAPWEQGSGVVNAAAALQVDTRIYPEKVVTNQPRKEILIQNLSDQDTTYEVQGNSYLVEAKKAKKISVYLNKPYEYIPIRNTTGMTYSIPAMLSDSKHWTEGIEFPEKITGGRIYHLAIPNQILGYVVFEGPGGVRKRYALDEKMGVYSFQGDYTVDQGKVLVYNITDELVYSKNINQQY